MHIWTIYSVAIIMLMTIVNDVCIMNIQYVVCASRMHICMYLCMHICVLQYCTNELVPSERTTLATIIVCCAYVEVLQ